jgi:uncharacterized protein (DUF849 family)
MIVQACLNGSRAIGFHQRLPLTSEDIANEGASRIAAGAAEPTFTPVEPRGKKAWRPSTRQFFRYAAPARAR